MNGTISGLIVDWGVKLSHSTVSGSLRKGATEGVDSIWGSSSTCMVGPYHYLLLPSWFSCPVHSWSPVAAVFRSLLEIKAPSPLRWFLTEPHFFLYQDEPGQAAAEAAASSSADSKPRWLALQGRITTRRKRIIFSTVRIVPH